MFAVSFSVLLGSQNAAYAHNPGIVIPTECLGFDLTGSAPIAAHGLILSPPFSFAGDDPTLTAQMISGSSFINAQTIVWEKDGVTQQTASFSEGPPPYDVIDTFTNLTPGSWKVFACHNEDFIDVVHVDRITFTVKGPPVGGEFLPIETTSLILAGAQTFSWMIPVILSVLGIGLFVVSRKSE